MLYHGTARGDSFRYPKETKDKRYDPMSWFTTSPEAAKRYANLSKMEPENMYGTPRVLSYKIYNDFKMLDLTDEQTLENYKKLFSDNNPKYMEVHTSGKHSMIYRVIHILHRLKHKGSILKHIATLKKLGVDGYIENGVDGKSIDFVFIDDNSTGADKFLY
jgi:hydroxymethylpyrimidine pyrophosphatase-like HAD family hydrolase